MDSSVLAFMVFYMAGWGVLAWVAYRDQNQKR
jgi:hypothetical protein